MIPNNYTDLYSDLIKTTDFKKYLTQKWEGKDVLESVFRLFSYLELFDQFKNYQLCQGNFNKKTIKPIENLIKERKKLMEKSLKDNGDKSDLTLIKCNQLIITSCKNYKKYNIGKLDIRDLLSILKDKYNDYQYRLCLVVRNKHEILEMVSQAKECNDDLKNVILNKETILIDFDDITQAYYKFLKLYPKNIKELFEYEKPLLNLKFHQELAIIKSKELIKTYHNILWGHIPRSGKSYIMAGMILESKANNFLVITTSPNETINQYLKMFDTYQQFNDFNIVYLNGKNKKPTLTNKNIIICSKQFLQSKDKTKKIKWLEDLVFDIRFIDESHNGGTTELAQKTLNLYGNNKITKTFYITATYLKPTNNYQIPKEAWVLWDLEDVVLCKNILSSKYQKILIKKYGENVSTLLKEYNLSNIKEDYSKYPKLEILSWKLNQEISNTIKNMDNYDDGFSIESILLLKNEVKDDKVIVLPKFQNEEKVKELSWNIFGKKIIKNNLIREDKTYKYNFLNRIKQYINSVYSDSRWFNKNKPLSILCFLPVGMENMPIDILSNAYQNFLEKEKIIPDFNIVSINSKNNNGANPKDIVDEAYQKTINDNKSGLLILSGKQLSLGVSIPHCDIVILMNNITSMDMIYQMMFRCMTEDDNKKSGFVIDLNLDRSINMITDYSTKIYNSSSDIKKGIKKILSQNLIGFNSDEWNKDIFGIQYNNIDEFIHDIYKTYVSHPSKALDKILKLLNFKSDIFTKDENIMIKKLFTIDNSTKNKKIILDFIKDLSKPDINKGIEEKSTSSPTNSEIEKKKKEKEEKEINIMTDIMKHLIPLLSLLTIHNEKSSFEEQIELIENNNILKNILLEQIHTWWGNKFNQDILNLFLVLYQKRLKDNKDFNMVCSRTKEMFYQNISNSKELSKLIDKYLIPQELEKKTNAEVSTPYKLRHEMLDKIPLDFWSKKQKVFEPCSGKGGFLMDIVEKFMIGLKDKYPDDKKRYKIIVEKCLYFSDINPTNIFLNKLLLDPYGDYKLNYNEGNTLDLDIKDKWDIEGFDAVIGNPPYQAVSINGMSKGGGNNLYTKFIYYADKIISKYGYLLFINPPTYFSPGRNNNKNDMNLRKDVLDKYYYHFINLEECSKYFNVGSKFIFFLLQKNNYKNDKLNIVCKYKNNIYNSILKQELLLRDYLPYLLTNESLKILDKVKNSYNDKLQIFHSPDNRSDKKHVLNKLKKESNEEYKKRAIKNGYIYPIQATSVQVVYSSKKCKNQNDKKVLMSRSGYLKPFYDNGIIGVGGDCFACLVNTKEEGNKIIQLLNSKLYSFYIEVNKWSGFHNKVVLQDLPNIINNIKDINNQNIYEHFNLTKKDIELVENSL